MINQKLSYNNILKIRKSINPYIINTPIIKNSVESNFPNKKIYFKLEFLQNAGCFKTRGAINNILHLSKDEQTKGVIAVSAGNHAVAVAYASKILNINCKVIMFKSSNEFRLKKAKNYGSEVIIAKNALEGFQLLEKISKEEDRIIIHPFDSLKTIQGSATLGLEVCEYFTHLDNIVISVGGGGLISGISSLVKQKFPNCNIIGVEPKGASGISKSLKLDKPLNSVKINTIADSLGPPFHLPFSFSICKKYINKMILVSDFEMKKSMKFMSVNYNMILEPAAVATIAALQGKLKNKLKNQTTLVILCGSNIDMRTWSKLVNK